MFVYAWEPACLKAVLETDKTKILSRIAAARSAIVERLYNIGEMTDDERREIFGALKALGTLEAERVLLRLSPK